MRKDIKMRINDTQVMQLDDIKEKMGFTHRTNALQYAISLAFTKLNPVHTPEGRAQAKELKQRKVCSLLNGTVQDNLCHYTSYVYMNNKHIETYTVSVPLEELSESLVSKQYQGASKYKIISILNKKD